MAAQAARSGMYLKAMQMAGLVTTGVTVATGVAFWFGYYRPRKQRMQKFFE